MEEKQLELLFKKFLTSKGYPQGSMLSQVILRTADEGAFYPDLVILDMDNKEYVGLVEFKTKIDKRIEVNTLGQFYKYFSLLGTQAIPAYLVFPISEDDFQILSLTKENTFEPITKEEFPAFETLSAKRLTDQKIKHREVEEKTLIELQRKKKRARQSAYFSILSLLLGITASIIALVIQQKGIFTSNAKPTICCDSLEIKYNQLTETIKDIEFRLNSIENLPSKTDTLKVPTNLKQIETRLKTIEDGISENPEKSLSILRIRQEIEILKNTDNHNKELTQAKIEAIKDEMDIQNAWMLGVLIAIFGTILSMVVPNLLPRKE